jgi:hypothetical protein
VHAPAELRSNRAVVCCAGLAYGPPDIYFQGLAKIVGRAAAAPGERESIMRLMQEEHTRAIDSGVMFEPPNYLIPTKSRAMGWRIGRAHATLSLRA